MTFQTMTVVMESRNVDDQQSCPPDKKEEIRKQMILNTEEPIRAEPRQELRCNNAIVALEM